MRLIKKVHPPLFWTLSMTLGLGLLIYALASLAVPAQAAPSITTPNQQAKPTDEFCLACHQQEGVSLTLGSESLPVTINPTAFGLSVHFQEKVACVDCHTNISDYPHPPVKEQSVRDFSIALKDSCKECHKDQYQSAPDSVHDQAFKDGDPNAPLCSSCHNPHTQKRLIGQESGKLTISARLDVPQTCAKCHQDKYDEYENSVHGKALTEAGNLDVPTCTDCHGVHNIHDPKAAIFRNTSPALCANCHNDPKIMDKYGISTDVLSTYLADFHGTNVQLFSEQFPDGVTNKAVCFDCHGVHDIAKINDPQNGVAVHENLLVKCQRCHPDATANFADAWMGHKAASPSHYPIVYYVNLFYKILIPGVIGGMIFFILTDIYRRRVNRAKGVKHS